jgi:hypothetical protein
MGLPGPQIFEAYQRTCQQPSRRGGTTTARALRLPQSRAAALLGCGPAGQRAGRAALLQRAGKVTQRRLHGRRLTGVAGQAGPHGQHTLLLGNAEGACAFVGGRKVGAGGQKAGPGVGGQAVLRQCGLFGREVPAATAARRPGCWRWSAQALARLQSAACPGHNPAPPGRCGTNTTACLRCVVCAAVGAKRRRNTGSGGAPAFRLRSSVMIMPGTKVSTVSPPRSPRPLARRTPSAGRPARKSLDVSIHSPCTNLLSRWSWP